MFNATVRAGESCSSYRMNFSRWGWLAGQIYSGGSSPIYGTLTFGRQNTPFLDGVNAYDPMGGSYAFSLIGNSGKTCGDGDTEYVSLDHGDQVSRKYRRLPGWSPCCSRSDYSVILRASKPITPITAQLKAVSVGTSKISVPAFFFVRVRACEKDVSNWSTLFPGQKLDLGWPITFPVGPWAVNLRRRSPTARPSWRWLSIASVLGRRRHRLPWRPLHHHPLPVFTLYAGYSRSGRVIQATRRASSTLMASCSTPPTPVASNYRGKMHTIANNAFNALCGWAPVAQPRLPKSSAPAPDTASPRCGSIGAYYHYIQNSYVNGVNCSFANAPSNSRCRGLFDVFSAVLDWRFLPKWDTFIGTMYSAAFGGFANGDIFPQQPCHHCRRPLPVLTKRQAGFRRFVAREIPLLQIATPPDSGWLFVEDPARCSRRSTAAWRTVTLLATTLHHGRRSLPVLTAGTI